MTALVDANGSRTQWAYDSEGRLVTKTYADASTYTYTYDAGGRLLTRTDAKSQPGVSQPGVKPTFSGTVRNDVNQP
jgi:YD repeat-containing protein